MAPTTRKVCQVIEEPHQPIPSYEQQREHSAQIRSVGTIGRTSGRLQFLRETGEGGSESGTKAGGQKAAKVQA